MLDYLETLRMKPGHVRRRIAVGSAAGVTLVVALAWLAVASASGTFLIAPPTVAPTLATADPAFTGALGAAKSNFTSLLGAAGASFGNGPGTAPAAGAGIVIDTEASTTVGAPQPTSIPF